MNAIMGRMLVAATIVCILLGAQDAPSASAMEIRGDVEFLVSSGIVSASSDGEFRLKAPLTRAELAAMTVRMAKLDAVAKSLLGHEKFTDVSPQNWASGYAVVAHDRNYVPAVSARQFAPSSAATWQELIEAIASVCEITIDDYYSFGQRLGYSVYDMTAAVSRGDAFAACSRALLIASNDGRDILSDRFASEKLTALVISREEDQLVLEVDGTSRNLEAVGFVDIPHWPGLMLDVWIRDDVIVAAKLSDSACFHTGRVAETYHADDHVVIILTDDSQHTVPFGASLLYSWIPGTVDDQLDLNAGDMIGFVTSEDVVTSIWIQPYTEGCVVVDSDDWLSVICPDDINQVDTRGIQLLDQFFWRRSIEYGDVIYPGIDDNLGTALQHKVIGQVTAVAVDGRSCTIGDTQFAVDRCWIFASDSQFISTVSDLAPLELTGNDIRGTLGFDGDLMYAAIDVTPAQSDVLIVEHVNDNGIHLLDGRGRSMFYLGHVDWTPVTYDLVRCDGENKNLISVVGQDTYLLSHDVDPVRGMIQDSDGQWRKFTDNTAIFYIAADSSVPFHAAEVCAVSPHLLRYYHLGDPAGGTVASLISGHTGDGYVIQAVRLHAVVAPAYFVAETMFGLVIAVEEVRGEPAMVLFISGQLCVIPVGDAVIRSRTGTHGGAVTDDTAFLRSGEVVRLEFDVTRSELLSVTEMQARPYGLAVADFKVVSVDKEYESITLQSVFHADLCLELLVTSETIIFDASSSLPQLATIDDIMGAIVHIITDSDDGIAGVLVVVRGVDEGRSGLE